jgi:tRNA threonylcarbamoyladenosine biosynthesis protein TsaB
MSGNPSDPPSHKSPLVLGIETSGLAGSIALCRGTELRAESRLEEAPRRHAQTLVLQIGTLLREAGASVHDLDVVAVSVGPGSFTGLRVGVVCAKTLAYATGCQLAAVDTLRAIAANAPTDVSCLCVMADALRGDAYVASYRRDGDDWKTEHAPRIAPAQTWVAERQPGEVISGPGLATYAQVVPSSWRQLGAETWTPLARVVAQLGLGQVERGETADCATLIPFYLRRSSAEERKLKSS